MKLLWVLLLIVLVNICCQRHPNDVVVPQVQVSTVVSSSSYQNTLWYLAFDSIDNLYVSDTYSHKILKISVDNTITTFAGSGTNGLSDGVGLQAQFSRPQGITLDANGNLYVAQSLALRKITPDGSVTTIAGTDYRKVDFTKPDSILFVTTPAIILDKKGNILVADYADNSFHNRIVKVTPDRKISVLLGRQFSYPIGPPIRIEEQVKQPVGLVFDSKGNMFVADKALGIIKVTPDGVAQHFSGTILSGHNDGPASKAQFGAITSLTIDKADNLYVGDEYFIRKISPDGTVSTIAGSLEPPVIQNGKAIYKDGTGNQAQFYQPQSLAFDSKGNLFVADAGGIRKIILK